ncbi:glycosyltransferase family 2 protein [Cryobacterium soli]|uniref:glycosyltransferase family 2 protein n=1 Tax=Cryobacterium soli TaxID=2220095 RepID=UPI000E7248D6|nr:glycosyltransferase family 2 protein [Cryobacterium soli]
MVDNSMERRVDAGDRLPVILLILTKNEEKALPAALEHIAMFQECFVVDSESTDATREIAESLGATVVDFSWDRRYPKKKEWAQVNVPSSLEWCFFLDADERLTEDLIREIRSTVHENTLDALDSPLAYKFAGKFLRHGHRVKKRALVRRSAARWPRPDDLGVKTMWEVEGHYQPLMDGKVGAGKASLIHDDPDGFFEYFSRHNRYSDWEAHLAVLGSKVDGRGGQGLRASLVGMSRRIPLRGVVYFLYAFVLRRGFLDGRAGLDYAIAHAFYYWQIQLKAREIFRAQGR